MGWFFEKMNTAVAVFIVVVFLLVVNGFIFYRYQLSSEGTTAEPVPEESEEIAAVPDTTTGGSAPNPNFAEPVEAVFVHRAVPENTRANSTYLDHPLINGDPNAILYVTQNWNPGGGDGTYNSHPIGVWYGPNIQRWAIFKRSCSDAKRGRFQRGRPERPYRSKTIAPDPDQGPKKHAQ